VESIRYLALGDSYTIGTGLEDEARNFPSLLAALLKDETGIDVALVNLGVNGYTTTDLIREELPVAQSARPELVTILIGANDIVQGSDEAGYRDRLKQIYQAVKELGVPAGRVLAISIPDFSPLPGAAPFGSPSDLRARVDAFNDIAQREAASRPFRFADITSISREANRGDGWLAGDGLHPGPAQHRAFANHIWEEVAPTWRMVVVQRFSPSARRVVEFAFDEAAAQLSKYVGSEHLLMGLLKLEDPVCRRVFEGLRITYPRVRKTVAGVVGKSNKSGSAPSRPILTTRTTKMLTTATLEATKGGADAVAPEHLLIAVIEGDGIGSHILADRGATVAQVRATRDGVPAHREKWMRIRSFLDRF
jgi:lysophospholipase L1-like esterase